MCKGAGNIPSFPVTWGSGVLERNIEQVSVTGRSGTVFKWRNPSGGTRACQWLGFQSNSFNGKTFLFQAWMKFVGGVPSPSSNFGLKVCGTFYNSAISQCDADEWCRVSERVHCNGGDGNHVILIFDTVATAGQVVKIYDVSMILSGRFPSTQ